MKRRFQVFFLIGLFCSASIAGVTADETVAPMSDMHLDEMQRLLEKMRAVPDTDQRYQMLQDYIGDMFVRMYSDGVTTPGVAQQAPVAAARPTPARQAQRLAQQQAMHERRLEQQLRREQMAQEQEMQERELAQRMQREQETQEQLAQEQMAQEQLAQEQIMQERMLEQQMQQEQMQQDRMQREAAMQERMMRDAAQRDTAAQTYYGPRQRQQTMAAAPSAQRYPGPGRMTAYPSRPAPWGSRQPSWSAPPGYGMSPMR